MDKATIERLDQLRQDLYSAETRLHWLTEGGRPLYERNGECEFYISVARSDNGVRVLQSKISFEEADRMYQAELTRLTAERDEIQRQIDEL